MKTLACRAGLTLIGLALTALRSFAGTNTTPAALAGNSGYGRYDGPGLAARFGGYDSTGPNGVAVDQADNIYVADNQTIRRIAPTGMVTTVAGLAENAGSANGIGIGARFLHPSGVAVDGAGNIYVADRGNHTIRKVTPAGVVTTLAGLAGGSGRIDGTESAARFRNPRGVAVDSTGNVYVADTGNHMIRRVTPAGMVTTVAGLAEKAGSVDGPGGAAQFTGPCGVAVDSSGNVYVADTDNHTIRKIVPIGTNWMVATLAGAPGSNGSVDGMGSAARFEHPRGLAVDRAGNLYVADAANNTIRKVTPAGVVTTLAGFRNIGTNGYPIGESKDGTGSAARFSSPLGVAVDRVGNVYVADWSNHLLRKVTPAGVVTTLAGAPEVEVFSSADGTGDAARFGYPQGVAVDNAGNVYVADTSNHTIRKVTAAGVVTTLGGMADRSGSADGIGSAARFAQPRGLAVDRAGNLYVSDNQTIRKVTPAGMVTTLAGMPGQGGDVDGTRRDARFNSPLGVAVDRAGNLYVADSYNNTLRKVTAAGVATTMTQRRVTFDNPFVRGKTASFEYPEGVAVDGVGNVYVSDRRSIKKVTPGGVVTMLAGPAELRSMGPCGLAVDSGGNVYTADTDNNTIRKVAPGGVVTTLAGLAGGYGSNDGTGNAARFFQPYGVALDSVGNLYVAERFNKTIRKITPVGTNWVVTTLAGRPKSVHRATTN
ncbi:MAG: NHL domain-containing protein [Limisphaerales bacterium]